MSANILKELQAAQQDVERAKKIKCLCGPLVSIHKYEPCTCNRAQQIVLAELRLHNVQGRVRRMNNAKRNW